MRSAVASASSKNAPPGSVIMMNGQRDSRSSSVSAITMWLKFPSSLLLTEVRVNSENRNERFWSALG